MDNIYGQDEMTRNSIVELPDGFVSKAGNTLYSWLGSLWRGLHKGDDMVRGLQASRGIRLSQLYVDILEAANLTDRNGAPVFHRELWHPIVIRKSLRNKSQENMIFIGNDKKIGPQPPTSEYGYGYVFRMGKMANFENLVTYPIDSSIAGGAMSIVDNIVNPTVILENGKDYEIRNNSIVFLKENDPLLSDSPFDSYDLPDMISDGSTDEPDRETVLWASDVLIDRNYISDHLSYALGANAPSSDVVKRILNAAWSSVASGLTPELVKTLIASMLNIPTIQNEKETVTDITDETEDGVLKSRIVHTDMGYYRISPKATIRKNVVPGAVLSRGELLDETVRIYPFMGNPNGYESSYSVPIEQDIPSVVLSSSIIRAKTEYGIYAMWEQKEILQSEDDPIDANGNPHLYFDIGGTDSDVKSFWKNVWDDAEEKKISLSDIMGEKGCRISPAGFFMRHLVGQNTLFVVVDKFQADDSSMMRNPMFFDMLSDVVPSAIRLFLVEHSSVGEDDLMEMDKAVEHSSMAASVPEVKECVNASESNGLFGTHPSYGEHVSARFVRISPVKVRIRKEEEI